MTITEAIQLLQRVQDKQGDVLVYFDCPHCLQSFTPTQVVTKAIVVGGTSAK